MEAESSFSVMAPPVFNGDNYQTWAVRTKTYLDAMDMGETVEKDYEVPLLPNNPTMAQTKIIKTGKSKNQRQRPVYFQQYLLQSSLELCL